MRALITLENTAEQDVKSVKRLLKIKGLGLDKIKNHSVPVVAVTDVLDYKLAD